MIMFKKSLNNILIHNNLFRYQYTASYLVLNCEQSYRGKLDPKTDRVYASGIFVCHY